MLENIATWIVSFIIIAVIRSIHLVFVGILYFIDEETVYKLREKEDKFYRNLVNKIKH